MLAERKFAHGRKRHVPFRGARFPETCFVFGASKQDLACEMAMSFQKYRNCMSDFEIRLNSTYRALLSTQEPVDITIAEKLRDSMDEIIQRNQTLDDVKIIERHRGIINIDDRLVVIFKRRNVHGSP